MSSMVNVDTVLTTMTVWAPRAARAAASSPSGRARRLKAVGASSTGNAIFSPRTVVLGSTRLTSTSSRGRKTIRWKARRLAASVHSSPAPPPRNSRRLTHPCGPERAPHPRGGSPAGGAPLPDFGERFFESPAPVLHLGLCDQHRRCDPNHVPVQASLADQQSLALRGLEERGGLFGRRLLGLPIFDELDPLHQPHAADVADECE